MTKKSIGRIQRDLNKNSQAEAHNEFEKLRKSNKSWDDLEAIYIDSKTMLLAIPSQISDMYSVKGIDKFLPNQIAAADCLRCLGTDLKVLHGDLEKIHNSHVGKAGICVDDNDFISSLTIAEAYNAFRVKFEGVILPTVQELGIQFDKAVEKVNEIIKKDKDEKSTDGILDPTVITDVEVKEKA